MFAAAEMACRYAERPEKVNLRAALARFKAALPGLVGSRGVLEHFDAYTDVEGKPAVLYEVTFIRGDGKYLISVGGVTIDVDRAAREVMSALDGQHRRNSGGGVALSGGQRDHDAGIRLELSVGAALDLPFVSPHDRRQDLEIRLGLLVRALEVAGGFDNEGAVAGLLSGCGRSFGL